jgi:triacylglycerol esterase/lipase EstA (alpha/beta hydrolase family)
MLNKHKEKKFNKGVLTSNKNYQISNVKRIKVKTNLPKINDIYNWTKVKNDKFSINHKHRDTNPYPKEFNWNEKYQDTIDKNYKDTDYYPMYEEGLTYIK